MSDLSMIEAMLSRISSDYDTHEVFRPRGMDIRADRILRLHGYRDMDKVRPIIGKAAESVARTTERIVSPEVHYKRYKVARCDAQGLLLENGAEFNNPAFQKYFAGVNEVVVFVMTLGAIFDDQSRTYVEQDDGLEALFLESAGWLGIEWTTKRFGVGLRNLAQQNASNVLCRMGPGYSYSLNGEKVMWQLEDQQPLFDVFEGDELPISLMESCAMMPRMSRSGLYGIAPKA